MQPIIAIQIAGIVLLILFSAFFSGSETAYFSLSSAKVRKLERSKGRSGRLVAKLLGRPQRLLISIVLANMLVNIASSVMAENVAASLLGHYGWIISTLLMIVIILIFGEITPKIIAIQNAEKVSVRVAPVIDAVSSFVSPLRLIVNKINDGFMRFVGRGSPRAMIPVLTSKLPTP